MREGTGALGAVNAARGKQQNCLEVNVQFDLTRSPACNVFHKVGRAAGSLAFTMTAFSISRSKGVTCVPYETDADLDNNYARCQHAEQEKGPPSFSRRRPSFQRDRVLLLKTSCSRCSL